MQATLAKSDLLRAIQITERAVSTKSSLPILGTLMLEVAGPKLTIMATDLELSLVAEAEVTDGKDGALAIPACQFVEFIKAMPEGSVTLKLEEGKLIAKCGKSRYKAAPCGTREEFPVLAPVAPKFSLTVGDITLRELLARVAEASSSDDSRPILNGVLWKTDGGEGTTLTLVATDTHRLHFGRCPIEGNHEQITALVPARTCQEIIRLLRGGISGSEEVKIEITLDENQIQVKAPTGVLTSRLISGAYPQYARVIPTLTDYVSVNRDDLAKAITRASIVAKEDAARVTLTFQDDGTLNVSSKAPGDGGVADEEIEITGSLKHEQNPVIASNWKFLLAAVKACPEEAVRFYHTAANKPILLHNADDSTFSAVIMPMTLV